MFSNLFVGKHAATCEVKPQKSVIRGTFVIDQDSIINIEKEDSPTHKNPNTNKPIVDVTVKPVHRKDHPEISTTQTPHVKNISTSFNFTEYHKQNLNNVYINLTYQTECMGFPHHQCWSSKLEFENETIDNFHVNIDGLFTPECKIMLNTECTRKQRINCFKMECENNWLYVYSNNTDSKDWLLPQKGVFFLLEKGNYHSSWQAGTYFSSITLENSKFAQDVIKTINYYEYFPENQLLLTFTKIHENYNMTFTSSWFPTKMMEVPPLMAPTSSVPQIKREISLHSEIQTGSKLDVVFLLHERVHEYINRVTLQQKCTIYEKQWVYTGDKTIDLVLKDSKSDTELSKSLVFMNETGKYGLSMQDRAHLGDWGPGSGASNYQNSISNIGKYTMSVINEFGYYMT